ncbi:MAG: alpha/beta hydrolase [Nevskiaceae bacterium]|nr:MAG: alpha/beta hydrolase [Nevskiaceae bacterium]TBR72649.1 MAG: alpha/beta hydrolase [Nevskiaceae bacterium]
MGKLDPDVKNVLDAMAASGITFDQLSPAEARQAFADAIAQLGGSKPDVEVQIRDWQGPAMKLPLRVYRPKGTPKDKKLPALLYIHGGGWVIGDLDVYDRACRVLCEASGCAVLSFEYRLAPEHKFPAAAEDACAVAPWAVKHAGELGIDTSRLAVGGDSAGGNLAAVAALAARDAGGLKLKHQLLIFPVCDITQEFPSGTTNAEGYFLTAKMMQYFGAHYLDGPEEAADWRMSPNQAKNHANLPSATVVVAEFDPLRDDGIAYGETLKKAGVHVDLMRFDGVIHDFTLMDGAIPAGRAALKKIGAAVGKALA